MVSCDSSQFHLIFNLVEIMYRLYMPFVYLIPDPIFDPFFLVLGVIVLVQIAQDIGTEAKSQQDFLDQLVCNFFLNSIHSC